MPEDNTTTPPQTSPAPTQSVEEPSAPESLKNNNLELIPEIVDKINEAQNILIALSSDPSVDEMASAIGLSLFLDRLGKRATAIYSGSTPNALEFLKPEDTFEPTVNAIQDFVIALNKDKADHLRYKLDGDFVKIYITPYKTRISEEDLDYSYGDYNIDLVFALDVANGTDFDNALREHGRIMHDAVIINITTGNPGKLGEIEWSNKKASSIAEMIATLIFSMGDKAKMDKDEATALLTGIVAATSRFSNSKTTAESMRAASRLMESGANQQLISKNITADTQNEIFNMMNGAKKDKSPTPPQEKPEEKSEDKPEAKLEENPEENPDNVLDVQQERSELLDDLKAAEENLAQTSADTAEVTDEPTEPATASAEEPATDPTEFDVQKAESFVSDKPEKILQPSTDDFAKSLDSPEQENKYGQMLEDALSGVQEPTTIPTTPTPMTTAANPAAASAPVVPTSPEINGVPQMNYMPLPGDQVLPPPPTPPIDMASAPPTPPAQPVAQGPAPVVASAMPLPAVPTAVPTAPVQAPVAPPATPVEVPAQAPAAAPTAPTAPAAPAAPANPSAFQIPGM